MHLKISLLNPGPMVSRASFILHVLQGNGLDDLVRESIQNSLDAAIAPKNPSHNVFVDFTINEVNSQHIASLFDTETNERLLKRFSCEESYKLMVIRDSGTTGLTGDWEDLNSNIYKLVRDIGRAQAAAGAGGAFGLGKTIFSLMGPGLVGYYTKTSVAEGDYKEALVFSCIENEKESRTNDRITDSKTGIAWWTGENGKPIANSEQVRKILKTLGIEPYQNDETGTTILIPYFGITSQKLLPSQDSGRLTFESSEIKYIHNAIQRWYCNRVVQSPDKCRLQASVNGKIINKVEPTFETIQLLKDVINKHKSHNLPRNGLALSCTKAEGGVKFAKPTSEQDSNLIVKPIRINKHIHETAPTGWLAAIKVDDKSLGMGPPDNRYSPHKYIFGNNENIDERSAILGMCRGFEMIVDYNTGDWTNGLKTDREGDFIIGLFMLNSDAKLASTDVSLEEYIRSIEDPTHKTWSDKASTPKIAEGIKNNVKKAISDAFALKAETYKISDAGEAMRAQLGKALLPDDFGSFGTSLSQRNTPVAKKTRIKRSSEPILKIINDNISYRDDFIEIKMEIKTGTDDDSQPLCLSVLADAGSTQYNSSNWIGTRDELIGHQFPFEITKFEALKHKRKIDPRNNKYSIVIRFNEAGIEQFDCIMQIKTNDKRFRPVLAIEPARTLTIIHR